MWLQEMPTRQQEALKGRLPEHPFADPGVEYPEWYFRRWHFLPEGYLSERGVLLYDRLIRPIYWAGSEGRVVGLVARWLERTGARRVLEVAPGPGRLLAGLRDRLPAVDFRAIELSPYFVALARRRLGDDAVIHGDARDLGRVAGVFDAVIGAHYLGHLPHAERGAAFEALVRVVRPGGSVVTIEHRWHGWPASAETGRAPVAQRNAGFTRIQFYRRRAGEGASP
jgi:SAM-dependent methyltransferase